MKNIPIDQDCNSERCTHEEEGDNTDLEGKPTSLYTNAKSKYSLAICEKHKPWHKSQGESVKCPAAKGLWWTADFGAKLWPLRPLSEPLILKLADIYWVILWLCKANFKAYSELSKAWRKNMKSSIVKSTVLKKPH